MCGVPKNHNTTVFVMDIGSQVVISQYKMDLFPLAVRAPRNYFLCQYKGSRRVWNPSYKTDLESKFWFLFAVFFSRLFGGVFPDKIVVISPKSRRFFSTNSGLFFGNPCRSDFKFKVADHQLDWRITSA
jgi:hypothetical protein